MVLAFGYNKADQVTSRSTDNDAYTYTLFDPAAPIAESTTDYSANGLNQYTAVGAKVPLYDANANLTSDGADWVYAYDAENRLVQAYNTATGGVATYGYDGKGRRASKDWKSSPSASSVITDYLYEGDEPIADYNGIGGILRRYAHGASVDERLVYWEYGESSGTLTDQLYYHANHQGSIIAMAGGTGVREALYTYDAYGVPGEADDGQPFRYTGRRYDPETGLYYYRARYYSASLGRFLQTDPIGYEDNMNLYGYTQNDPVNNTDPSGENAVSLAVRANRIGNAIGNNPAVLAACAKSNTCVQVAIGVAETVAKAKDAVAEIFNNDATIDDAEDILVGDAEPDNETSKGTKVFDDSPTGRGADDVMGDIKDLPGAETKETKGDRGKVTVVTLPDGGKVIDRNSKAGPRTVQTQRETENGKTKSSVEVRFPEDELRENN